MLYKIIKMLKRVLREVVSDVLLLYELNDFTWKNALVEFKNVSSLWI